MHMRLHRGVDTQQAVDALLQLKPPSNTIPWANNDELDDAEQHAAQARTYGSLVPGAYLLARLNNKGVVTGGFSGAGLNVDKRQGVSGKKRFDNFESQTIVDSWTHTGPIFECMLRLLGTIQAPPSCWRLSRRPCHRKCLTSHILT